MYIHRCTISDKASVVQQNLNAYKLAVTCILRVAKAFSRKFCTAEVTQSYFLVGMHDVRPTDFHP